jgi:hypothetical protein
MKNDEAPLPPCPECGGERVWFPWRSEPVGIDAGKGKSTWLNACTCLKCGATTLRPDPEMMEKIREWARTQKPFTLFW